MTRQVVAALRDARLPPQSIRYIEASGLGEPFGDAIEVTPQTLYQTISLVAVGAFIVGAIRAR
jgi:hypothetical protein